MQHIGGKKNPTVFFFLFCFSKIFITEIYLKRAGIGGHVSCILTNVRNISVNAAMRVTFCCDCCTVSERAEIKNAHSTI